MNDLSVLMPLPRSSSELEAMMSPTTPGQTGVLLPEALYMNDSSAPLQPYKDLKLVALRLDPCFGPTDPSADPALCDNQLRLVFQRVVVDTSGAASADDSAVHVFYRLSREQLLAAIDDIVAAREAVAGDDDLGPLAPNPLLVEGGLDGAFAHDLEMLVTRNAGEANIIRFTTFTLELFGAAGTTPTVADQFWQLQGHLVDAGQATSIAIPTLPPGTVDTMLEVLGGAPPLNSSANPVTSSPDNITLLLVQQAAQAATAEQRQSAFDAALRIENPHFHTPDTIDCISCHMAQPARDIVGKPLGSSADGNPNAFVAAGMIPASDLLSTTHIVSTIDAGLNMHAFSYRSTEPMINRRVINETAANLALVTQLRK
jgi:hypothetical protein